MMKRMRDELKKVKEKLKNPELITPLTEAMEFIDQSFKLDKKYKFRQMKVLMHLFIQRGRVTYAMINSGVSRDRYYKWRELFPEFKAATNFINSNIDDYVEGKLFSLLNNSDPKVRADATKFYLSRAHAKYDTEKSQVAHSGGIDGNLTVEVIEIQKNEDDDEDSNDNSLQED